MRCTNCGQEVAAGLKFCTYCGTPVQQEAPQSSEAPRQPESPDADSGQPEGDPYGRQRQQGGDPYSGPRRFGGDPYSGPRQSGGDPYGQQRPQGGDPYGRQRPQGGDPYGRQRPQGGDPYGRQRPQGGDPYGRQRPQGGDPYSGQRPAGGGNYYPQPYGGPDVTGSMDRMAADLQRKAMDFFASFHPARISWRQVSMLISLALLLFSFISVMAPTAYARENTGNYRSYRKSLYRLASSTDQYFIIVLFLMSILMILVLLIMNHPWLSCLGYLGLLHCLGDVLGEVGYYYYKSVRTSFGLWFLLVLTLAGLFCSLAAGEGLPRFQLPKMPVLCRMGGMMAAAMSYLMKYYVVARRLEYDYSLDRNVGAEGRSLTYLARSDFLYGFFIILLLLATIFTIWAFFLEHPLLAMAGSAGMAVVSILVVIAVLVNEKYGLGSGGVFMVIFALLSLGAALAGMMLGRPRPQPQQPYMYY